MKIWQRLLWAYCIRFLLLLKDGDRRLVIMSTCEVVECVLCHHSVSSISYSIALLSWSSVSFLPLTNNTATSKLLGSWDANQLTRPSIWRSSFQFLLRRVLSIKLRLLVNFTKASRPQAASRFELSRAWVRDRVVLFSCQQPPERHYRQHRERDRSSTPRHHRSPLFCQCFVP